MTLEEQAILSNYIELTSLDSENRVRLVRDEINSAICVKKTVKCDTPSIYRRLQHAHIPGIPEIYLVIVTNDNEVIIIEEYIHGVTVERYFSENCADDINIAELGIAVCEILSKLHQLDPPIICRDIKPSNIMIEHGRYYLTDFNIARTYQENLKEDTHLLGTAPYAPPEQYGFGQTDAKSDLYSLGITLNVLRTGCLPKEKTAEGKLGEVIKRATHIDPAHRFSDADAMKRTLAGSIRRQSSDERRAKGLARFKSPRTIIVWLLYITWFIFLLQYDYDISVSNQPATLPQEIATRAIFFLIVFLPYFYNADCFGILEGTIGEYRDNKWKFMAYRIIYTLLISLGIPFILVLLFL